MILFEATGNFKHGITDSAVDSSIDPALLTTFLLGRDP